MTEYKKQRVMRKYKKKAVEEAVNTTIDDYGFSDLPVPESKVIELAIEAVWRIQVKGDWLYTSETRDEAQEYAEVRIRAHSARLVFFRSPAESGGGASVKS